MNKYYWIDLCWTLSNVRVFKTSPIRDFLKHIHRRIDINMTSNSRVFQGTRRMKIRKSRFRITMVQQRHCTVTPDVQKRQIYETRKRKASAKKITTVNQTTPCGFYNVYFIF